MFGPLRADTNRANPKYTFKQGGFKVKPRYHTQKELINARAKAMLPDPSFDVDGDGVVSSTVRMILSLS